MLIDSLDEQVRRITQLMTDLGTIERRLSQQLHETLLASQSQRFQVSGS